MIEQRLLDSPRSARETFRELFDIATEKTRTGAHYLLQLVSVNDVRRHQLRKLFHGPVLRDISEQVWVLDDARGVRVRYTPAAWKHYFAQLFIAPTFEEYTVKRTGEVKVRECRRSTEALSDDEFADFVLQVQAHAVVEWSVEFTEQHQEQPHE
ncbi:MAG: hypothetical protein ACRYGA_02250 [Janthinobacterium lividum]